MEHEDEILKKHKATIEKFKDTQADVIEQAKHRWLFGDNQKNPYLVFMKMSSREYYFQGRDRFLDAASKEDKIKMKLKKNNL
jgi:hypothetical protein